MNSGPNKPKKGPEESDVEKTKLDYLKEQKNQLRKNTKQSLKELRGKMHMLTIGARGSDIPSVRHGRFLEAAERNLRKIEDKYLKEFDALLDHKMSYQDLLLSIGRLQRRQKTEIGGYKDAIVYAVRAFAGAKGQVDKKEYAYFYTILENINTLSEHYGTDIGVLFAHIQQGNLNKQEWDKICEYIKQYPYASNVNNGGDSVRLSVTAFLFKAFNQNQRYKAVIEYSKRNSAKEAGELADALVKANVLNMKQYEQLMKEINGGKYEMDANKEREIKEAQDNTRKILRAVNTKLGSSMFINGAERVLNRKNIASFIMTGLGTLGMVTNYLSHLQSGKGLGRLVAGFKSPHFMFSAAVAAGGVHMLQKGMTAGSHGESYFSTLLKGEKRLTNPFGVGKGAEVKDGHFEDLVTIFKDHKLVEKYFLEQKGFDDLADFHMAKRFDRTKRAVEIREEKGERMGEGMNLFDEYLQFIEKKRGKNSPEAIMFRETGNRYGKAIMTRQLIKVAAAQQALGITTSEYFNKTNMRSQLFTHKDLLLHREGVRSIPRAKLPEVRAQKAAEEAKKKKQTKK